MKHRLLPLAMAVIMMLALLAGCTGGGGATTTEPPQEPNTPATQAPSEPNTPEESAGFNINVCIASEPDSIDPALNTAVDGAVMMHHMFEGLMKWAPGTSGADDYTFAELVPGQATSYDKEAVTDEATGDELTVYTFTLRDDAKWSDGQPVTADDFVYAWQRLAAPETAADYNYMIDMVLNANEIMAGDLAPEELGIRAVDEKTLEITLFYDCPYFLEICAFPAAFPIRQDVIESAGDQWTFDTATYIGNGSYKMAEWSHNAYILLEKNTEYYDYANLGPDTIKFVLMDDHNAMYAAYRSDDLDFIEEMPLEEIPGLKDSGELTIADYIGTYFVCFQTQKAPFDDARIRKAFSLVIDRNYIVENITRAGQLPASGYVPSGIYDAAGPGSDFRSTGGDYYSVAAADYEANCAEARALLAEAGYPDGEGFPVVEYLYNTSDAHKAVAEALQQMWKNELGVTVTLQNEEWGTFIETRKEGNYQIARHGWIGDFNDPITFIDMFISTSGNNDCKYDSAEYDEFVRIAKSTSDPSVRIPAMHDAEDLLMGDMAVAPIYYYTIKWLLKDDVQGLYYTPLGYMFFNYISR